MYKPHSTIVVILIHCNVTDKKYSNNGSVSKANDTMKVQKGPVEGN